MARHTHRFVVLISLFAVMVPALVAAEQASLGEPTPASSTQRVVRGQLGASFNNPGLQNTLEVSWTRPLSASTSPLFADAHLAVALVSVTTPAVARLGGWVEYSPLSILDIRAGVEPAAYFGRFNSLLSFSSYADPYDRETRDARKDLGELESGWGSRAYVSPALKLKRGHLVARAGAEFERWSSSASGPIFYEPTRDVLVKSDGDYLVNTSTVVMYQHDDASGGFLSGGLVHNLTHVFDAPDNRCQRLGLIGVREFGTRHFFVPRLRLTATVWRYLHDPSKQNQWGGALAIGFRTGKS